jgi:hypothetical protein
MPQYSGRERSPIFAYLTRLLSGETRVLLSSIPEFLRNRRCGQSMASKNTRCCGAINGSIHSSSSAARKSPAAHQPTTEAPWVKKCMPMWHAQTEGI